MNTTTRSPQDRLLTQLARIPACQKPVDGADWFPPVDILEDGEDYLFKIDLPEVNPDNLRVSVEEDDLVISGERANPWQGQRKLLRVERPYGYFARRFALPDDANSREISTLFAESILEIRVRKEGSRMRPPAPTNAAPRLRLHSTS
jgi:HSP20 family molecular chaperone IbpA